MFLWYLALHPSPRTPGQRGPDYFGEPHMPLLFRSATRGSRFGMERGIDGKWRILTR